MPLGHMRNPLLFRGAVRSALRAPGMINLKDSAMTLMRRLGAIPGPTPRAPEPVFAAFADHLRALLAAERRRPAQAGTR